MIVVIFPSYYSCSNDILLIKHAHFSGIMAFEIILLRHETLFHYINKVVIR